MNHETKTAVVTGANSGLGFETALALYQQGFQVIVAGRNAEKCQEAITRIRATGPGGALTVGELDLSRLQSVKTFALSLGATINRLDLLVNNAGVMVPPAGQTAEGYEQQFGVNFVGHFALTGRLFPLLESTLGARVVTLSSIGHRGASLDFENFKLEKPYDPWREYGQSKLADLIFALELHRRLSVKNCQLSSLAAHPGISRTDLQKNVDPAVMAQTQFMTALEGAQPTLKAALSPESKSGQYWGPGGPGETSGSPAIATVDPAALDLEQNAQLWDWAQTETQLHYP